MTDPITASDAPSLVSMLAEMRLAAVDYDERTRRAGDTTEAQADIYRTERALDAIAAGDDPCWCQHEPGDSPCPAHGMDGQ